MTLLENNDLNIDKEIQRRVEKGHSYMDAILLICEEHDLEQAYIAKFLSKPVIEKLRQEGEERNLLPKTAKLPL